MKVQSLISIFEDCNIINKKTLNKVLQLAEYFVKGK